MISTGQQKWRIASKSVVKVNVPTHMIEAFAGCISKSIEEALNDAFGWNNYKMMQIQLLTNVMHSLYNAHVANEKRVLNQKERKAATLKLEAGDCAALLEMENQKVEEVVEDVLNAIMPLVREQAKVFGL